MSQKSRVFFFHYNKPASKKANKTMWSVHWNNACYIVENIDCRVPVLSKTNKRQPFATMKGKGRVKVNNKTAVIT